MELQKHFEQLDTASSWQSPLAVIAHIDLDAFYAQVQAVSANIDPSEPLCCRQWGSVIAVNYPAREFGIKRNMSVQEVRQKCPDIHLPHVATFKKGETMWKMVENPDMETHKVSLDLFRSESRKIFSVFKKECKLVEKAGIDEGFIDLGPEVRELARSKFPQLVDRDPSLPLPPLPELFDLKPEGLLYANQVPQTWHECLIALGSQIIWKLRNRVYQELKYTCSAGIASSKVIAKLGSACNKPFNQTVVDNAHLEEFLAKFELRDAWGWGGKLGDHVTSTLNLPHSGQFAFIREFSLESLQSKLQDEKIAMSLYNLCRGSLIAEITKRTTIKSMASVKQFKSGIKTKQDIKDWLKVYCSDLTGRLKDLAVDNNGVEFRPKVLAIKWWHDGASKSKQFSSEKLMSVKLDQLLESMYTLVLSIAENLIPVGCTMLSLDASSIEELPKERAVFESLFVDDNDDTAKYWCDLCRHRFPNEQEHKDWHFAKSLHNEQIVKPSQPGPRAAPVKVPNSKRPASKKRAVDPKQGRISDFFK